MNKDFPRMLKMLRREAKISQKKAAQDLGLNQALLSHYENGNRECRIEFVLKAAGYYNVSADYLLGKSQSRTGAVLSKDDIPRVADFGENTKDFSAVMTKRMIVSSVEIIYSIMAKIKGDAELAKSIGVILSLAAYRSFRLVHMCNPNNEENIFAEDASSALRTAFSAELAEEARALRAIAEISDEAGKVKENDAIPEITHKFLEKKYGTHAVAMMNLMKNCEKRLQKYEQI